MADWRKLHPNAGHSAKVSALTDFEYRVWTQYILSANDLGVMPAVAWNLQAGNETLQNRPTKKVQQALETVIAIGLVCVFLHQEKRYVWQPDWQDWQSIDWPRKTPHPLPDLALASPKTRELFEKYTKKFGENSSSSRQTLGENSASPSRELSSPSYARAQALNPNPHPSPNPAVVEALELSEESPRETTALAPLWRAAGPRAQSGLINGADIRRHAGHAWCAEREGLCVPMFLHAEFVGKLGGTRTDAELTAWYPSALALFANRAIGEDALIFWRNAFAHWVGTVTRRPSSGGARTDGTLDAAREVLDDIARGVL